MASVKRRSAYRLRLSFIADGVHIPFPALRNYLDLAGLEGKCLVTTDAIAAARLGPGTYQFSRWTITVGEDFAARSPDGSHLVGSAISMPRAVENLRNKLGLDATGIQILTNTNPRQSIGNLGDF